MHPRKCEILCSPMEVTSHQKVILDRTQLLPHLLCQFEALCGEFRDIFSQHQDDIGHTKLVMMNIKIDEPPIAQKC